MKNAYNKPIEWLFDEKYRWGLHLLFWLVIYADEWTSFLGITESMPFDWRLLTGFMLDVAMVYFIIYWVLPRYLLKGKHRMFLLITVQIVVVNSLLQFFLQITFEEYSKETSTYLLSFLIGWSVNTMLIVGVAVGFKVFKNFIRNEIKLNELENDRLRTELVYLKNQINPHFLFNSLNNIYVLNRKAPAMASESILMLSDLLRYQIYDCAKERVLLKDELTYLQNFLEMDKLRKDNIEVTFTIEGTIAQQQIAPFVFLPFVENAIKHGASVDNEQGYFKLQLNVVGKGLKFIVENSKPRLPLVTETGGIGLANVHRRLEILYPKKHQLTIEDEPKFYRITLELPKL